MLALSREVEQAVRDMPVRYTGSRAQHVRLAPPAAGEVLQVCRVDGVQVAQSGRQERIDMTDISTVAVNRRRIEAERKAAALAERQREIAVREAAARVERQREIAVREAAAVAERQREIPVRGPSIGRF